MFAGVSGPHTVCPTHPVRGATTHAASEGNYSTLSAIKYTEHKSTTYKLLLG